MKFIQAIVAVATTSRAAAAMLRRALLVFCALAAFASASAHAAVWIQTGGNGTFVVRWDNLESFQAQVSFTTHGSDYPFSLDHLLRRVETEHTVTGSLGTFTGELGNGTVVVARVRFCSRSGKQGCGGYKVTAPAVVGSPGVPRNLRITTHVAGFNATWDAPLQTGAGTISDYALQWRLDSANQSAWNSVDNSSQASATERSAAADAWQTMYRGSVNPQDTATQKALVRGSTYQVRIAAVSTIGIGQWSAESPLVPGVLPISAPQNFQSGTIQQNTVRLLWEHPMRIGADGAVQSFYFVRWSEGAGTSNWVTLGSATNDLCAVACFGRTVTAGFVNNLKAGTAHEFQLRASNEAGDGADWTQSVRITTASVTAPTGAPFGFSITPQPGNKLLLEWTLLTDRTSGGGLSGYRYRWSNDGNASTWESSGGEDGVAVSNPNADHVTIDVAGGRTYVVQVAAYNGEGTGPWTSSQTAFIGAPPAPTGLQISVTPGTLMLTWSAPSGDAGITEYRYRWSNNGDDGTWESAGGAGGVAISGGASATSATIAGVTNGVTYHVQIAAVNALGDNWTSAVMGRPFGKPGQPGAISAAVGDTSLLVSWQAPSERGGATEDELRYQVQWRAASVSGFAGGDSADIAARVTSHRISGLTNGIAYVVQVRAVNDADVSIWGEARSTPRGFTLDVDGSGGDADENDGLLIARYLLGLRGAPLTNGLTLADGVTAADIEATLSAKRASLDFDNSGEANAADGIIAARYFLGVQSGTHLTDGQTMTEEATVIQRIMDLLP